MISWDSLNKQILTTLCRHCPDEYFAPYFPASPHVGCCSYSPTFGLFEIHNMVKAGKRDFFLRKIYENERAEITGEGILVHANVDPYYEELVEHQELSRLEVEDLRLRFSICQFFEQEKGCGLPPAFKNSTCRSFICLAVEERLSDREKQQLTGWAKDILSEVDEFVHRHSNVLKANGWTLQNDIHQILDYLASVHEKEREGD